MARRELARSDALYMFMKENGACFIVRDANGEALSYVYYENEPGRRIAPGLLTRDEARRIGINFAKLPELLKHPF